MAEGTDSMTMHMTLVDWLDDLTVRFLLNLPPAELSSVPRLCFQVEEAQWFYEDFIRPANPTLPSLNLRQFLLTLFQHCPLLSGFDPTQHVAAYEEFLSYKVRVPVRGAILMDDSMEKVLLVRGWKKGASWSFPRGKINKDEKDLDCAIREVYEETGYDVAAAGLIKPNEGQDGQVKSIDITMREQHMKLFIVRRVPLDTHFEPRTRKEIGKISWYNVKDLPGFKKQKGLAGQGQGDAATSKFYMVAPFLGPLKKWIGQQRRNDHAAAANARHSRSFSANNDLQPGTTEDEIDTEQEFATDNGLGKQDQSTDHLKRVLSIGDPSPALLSYPNQAHSSAHTNSLLVMLKGSQSSLPHTPMDQIDPAFPTTQPETPQPHHPRHPSIGVQQQQHVIPQFPYSPQRIQQQYQYQYQQRNSPFPTSYALGAGSHIQVHGPQYQNQSAHFQELSQQHDRQQSLPIVQPGQSMRPFHDRQSNVAESSRNLYHQLQTSQNPAPQSWQSFTGSAPPLASPMPSNEPPQSQWPPFWQATQEVQKPLGSEHSVPEPSKLPPPKLNEHSLKLLNVFKSANNNNATVSSFAQKPTAQRAGSQQQAALLELFRKSSDIFASSNTSKDTPAGPTPVSPALTDVTVKPSVPTLLKRTSTLNEITRTLPVKSNAKSPVSPTAPAHLLRIQKPDPALDLHSDTAEEPQAKQPVRPPRTVRAAIPEDVLLERPKSRGQLYDPSKPQKSVRPSSNSERLDAEATKSPVTAQRPTLRHAPRSPKANAKAKQRTTLNETTNAVPQFSILQRPGSSAGRGTHLPPPQSPLRQEAAHQGFQPQLLKRSGSTEGDSLPEAVTSSTVPGDAKKDHLLSLFGKSSGIAATMAQSSATPATTVSESQAGKQQKSALLDLFNGAAAPPSTVKTAEPPPAPRLSPERKSSNREGQVNQQPVGLGQTSQQTLLSLFNRPSSSNLTSPGTPISPFTLSSPAIAAFPPSKLSVQASEPRSRLSSMASAVSSGGTSGQQTPKSATPTAEAKGFLLDYLNGVVQKEAYRGAKKQ